MGPLRSAIHNQLPIINYQLSIINSHSIINCNFFADFFVDMTTTTEAESAYEGRVSGSLSFGSIRAAYNGREQSKTTSQTRMITATMKLERYYSSLKEEVSPLSKDAFALVDSQDYVGFFKACGPNYVRGIRRAQEVTAILQFKSNSKSESKQFANGFRVNSSSLGVNTNFARESKFKSISSSLQIKIIGFGLGLNQQGSDTLVATSLQQYNEVMKFAFNTMTKNEDAHNIGMVYGIEVVPWVHNVAFQAAARLQDEVLELPLPRSVIPRAYKKKTISDPNISEFSNALRSSFRCKSLSFEIDKFGYCCESNALFDYANQVYDPNDPSNRICKPTRALDKTLVRDNMANNGEYIARLDSSMRNKLVQISVTEKCISAANSIPQKFDFRILKAQDSVKYDRAIETKMTLFDLKRAVDPLGDYGLVKHLGNELVEWIDMFYAPCMAALYGSNFGATPDLDESYFMAFPWHSHDECMHLSCLSTNMRWDRNEGGCTPGIMSGGNTPGYESGKDGQCSKDSEKSSRGNEEKCKYDQSKLSSFHRKVTNCWKGTTVLGTGQIDYFINHFCNPQLTGTKVSDDDEKKMIADATTNCGYKDQYN